MQTIYCFVEEQSEELNEFINLHDSDSVIHIYSSIVESCEGSLYFCLGELVNEYIHTEGKIWLVTDVKSLFDIAKKLCASLFEQIIYIEEQTGNNFDEKFSRTKKDFSEGLETAELIEYEIMVQPSKLNAIYMRKIWNLKSSFSIQKTLVFVYELKEIDFESNEKQKVMWSHFCELLLYEIDLEKHLEDYFGYRLLLYSILMSITKKVSYTNIYLNEVLNDVSVTFEEKYFVWNQFKNLSFKRIVSLNDETSEVLDKLYLQAYNGFKLKLLNNVNKIPKDERKKDVVLVSTIQFLDYKHAPTKTVIERCRILKKLGKEVVLVNTTEQYLMKGYLPLYNIAYGTVLDKYNTLKEFDIGDEQFPFIQIPVKASMSYRYKAMKKIIDIFKPYYILSIGSGSMVADLCGNIIPCASMSLVFSTLPHTINKMKILGRKLSSKEINEYNQNKCYDIIESRFTFELRPQTKTYTREELNLPNNKFILVVIGIRLQFEVTPDFLDMLIKVCKEDCYVVFAGKFENYQDLIKNYDIIAENSSFIGYCDEILALMEICDLYVNPARLGGGFSVIEAFEKGKPGVYLRAGDVYTAGGEDFAVDDYDSMVKEILKYKQDKKYYEQKSKIAQERAKIMTSSVEAIADLDNKICQRIEERYW